jgi:hypothetical protein
MSAPTLVLAHPPHGVVDLNRAAAVLRFAPVDVRLKANYSVPEIWLAHGAAAVAEADAAALRRAGLRVVAVPGAALGEIPAQQFVGSFAFEDQGLFLDAEERVTLDYDAAAIAVLFVPRPEPGKGPPPPAAVELFVPAYSGYQRWTILQGVTGFAGASPRQTTSFGVNARNFAADLERRFPNARVDRRLVNMQVRRRTGAPPPGMVRRGYSFATPALQQLLDSIAPGLAELEHQELSVRLAFLTNVGE